jgi:hypothetical protein
MSPARRLLLAGAALPLPALAQAPASMWQSANAAAAWIALIATGVTFAGTVVGLIWNARTSRRLEADRASGAAALARLNSELARTAAHEKTELDARTRYEFDARQRLYQQVEPALFLLGEVAEQGLHRIRNLALAARRSHLGSGPDSWTAIHADNYYLHSTSFRLIRPLACHRLLMERVTQVDFSLDDGIRAAMVLLKAYRDVLSSPFELAARPPARPYAYLHAAPGALPQIGDERVQRMQHVYVDQLENAVDALVTAEPGGLRLKRFSAFRAELDDPAKDTARLFFLPRYITEGFAPDTRPVLWRAILASALLLKAMLDLLAARRSEAPPPPPAALMARVRAEAWTDDLAWTGGADAKAALSAELDAELASLLGRLDDPLLHLRPDRGAG